MKPFAIAVCIAGIALPVAAQPLPLATKTPGERAFMRCYSCHSVIHVEDNLSGPNLAGLIGRKAGAVPAFAYSDAFKAADFTWSRKRLNQFLKDPERLVPGTSMPRPALTAKERKTVVKYLAGDAQR